MKQSSTRIWAGIGVMFAAVIYSVLLLTLKREFTLTNKIAYVFTLAAFLLLFMEIFVSGGIIKQYPMFDMPSTFWSMGYFLAQLVTGGIIFMVARNVPEWVAAASGMILMAVYLVGRLVWQSGKEYVQRQDEKEFRDISRIRDLDVQAETIYGMLETTTLSSKAGELVEAFRFSDPVRDEKLGEIEGQIEVQMNLLKKEAEEGRFSAAEVCLDDLLALIRQRNMALLAGKT